VGRLTAARFPPGRSSAVKWGGYNRKGEERMNKVFRKLFGVRGTWALLAVAAVAVLLAQNIKWRP